MSANPQRPSLAAASVFRTCTVGNSDDLAGQYKVELLSDRYLASRCTSTNLTQILIVHPEAGAAVETRSRMIFHQAGSKKFLPQVWIAGTSMHSEMAVQQKQERTLSQEHPKSQLFKLR
jgi:hypothetical protein